MTQIRTQTLLSIFTQTHEFLLHFFSIEEKIICSIENIIIILICKYCNQTSNTSSMLCINIFCIHSQS